jgi:hypothetical protein
MSKPSEGVMLKPVKWSELVKKEPVAAPIVATTSKYVPPSMRAEEAKKEKELTAGDLESAKLFPSLSCIPTTPLPPMLPTMPGASWSQIRNRIEGGMKEHIVGKLEAQKQTVEEQIRIENEGDPFQMSAEQRQKNGWETLKMCTSPREFFVVDGYYFTEEVPLWDGCPFTAPPETLGYR